MRLPVAALLLVLGLQSCKTPEPDDTGSDVKFAQGTNGAAHGHEKLTSLAVITLDYRQQDGPLSALGTSTKAAMAPMQRAILK